MRSPGWTFHPSREICRAKTSSAGVERKSPACCAAASKEAISALMPSSGPQARSTNSPRRPAGFSTASAKIRSTRRKRSVAMGRRERAVQPRARKRPIGVDRTRGYLEGFRGFVDREAAEEPKLHDPGLARVLRCQPLESEIDRENVRARLAGRHVDAVERHANRVGPSPSLGAPASRDVDEDASHHPGRYPEEVPSILPGNAIPPEQAQAKLIDERGRLEAARGTLPDQVLRRHVVQLLVDEGKHALERVRIAGAPGAEQLRDVTAVPRVCCPIHVWRLEHYPITAAGFSRRLQVLAAACALSTGRPIVGRPGETTP